MLLGAADLVPTAATKAKVCLWVRKEKVFFLSATVRVNQLKAGLPERAWGGKTTVLPSDISSSPLGWVTLLCNTLLLQLWSSSCLWWR